MKKILSIIFISILIILLSNCVNNVKIRAEEQQNDTEMAENLTSNELLDEENVINGEDIENASKGEKWLEKNIDKIFAVIIGGFLTVLTDFIVIVNKGKELKTAIKNAKESHENTGKEMKIAKELFNEVTKLTNDLKNNINLLKEESKLNTDVVNKVLNSFNDLNAKLAQENEKLNKIEKEFGVIVTKSKDFVVNGVAEEINNIIGG